MAYNPPFARGILPLSQQPVANSSFQLDVTKWLEKTPIKITEVVRLIALYCWKLFVERSPVLTGYFRGGWYVNLDDIGDTLPSFARPNVNHEVVAPPTLPDLSALRLGQMVFVVNNIHYGLELEEGSSTKSPAGVVRVSLEQVKAEMENIVRNVAGGGSAPAIP